MEAKLVGWIEETHGFYGDTVFKENDRQTHIVHKHWKRKTAYSEQEVTWQKG